MTKKSRPGFVHIEPEWMCSAAWLALSSGAGWLLIDIWRRHNGRNNGDILYTQRDAMRRFGCSSHTAVRWFYELEAKGFIIATRRGSFQVKSGAFAGRATTWRLTMLPCNGQPAAHDYLQWSPSHD